MPVENPFLLAVAVVGMVELVAVVLLSLKAGKPWFRDRPRRKGHDNWIKEGDAPNAVPMTGDDFVRGFLVLHPYFGYTLRPGISLDQFFSGDEKRDMLDPATAEEILKVTVNPWGFLSRHPLIYKPAAGEIVVACFGASAMKYLCLFAGSRIEARLGEMLGGRRVTVLSYAVGGYKQPQQLQVLSYLMARGQHFDAAVTMDGYNEAIFGRLNLALGIDPSLPAAHIMKPLKSMVGDPHLRPFGLVRLAKHLRWRGYAERLDSWRAGNFSALFEAIGSGLSRIARGVSRDAFAAVAEMPPDPGRDTLWLWPPNEEASLQRAVDLWGDSIRLMRTLCAARNIPFVHILQPHPAAGRKPLTAEEQALLNQNNPFAGPRGIYVREAFPLLRQTSRRLHAEGVRSVDSTGAFDRVRERVYADYAGHLNPLGNHRFAELVATVLHQEIEQKLRPASPPTPGETLDKRT